MEIILTTASFTIFIYILVSPIILLLMILKSKSKFKFITYFLIGLVLISINSIFFGWWTNMENKILLKHFNTYHINPDSNGYQVYYEKVLPENIEKVKSLEKNIMGIGWTLKSIFICFYLFLYLFFIYSQIQ